MPADTQTPTTELEAVNEMLATIGEAPINTLDVSGLADANIARNKLHKVSREIQNQSWWFNYEEEWTLTPNSDSELIAPSNTLQLYPRQATDVEPILRGQKVYDRANHTYKFNDSLDFDIVVFLPFDELPEAARHLVTVMAARSFQTQMIGSDTLFQFSQIEEQEAWRTLLDQDAEYSDYNALRGNPYMQRMTDRGQDPNWL